MGSFVIIFKTVLRQSLRFFPQTLLLYMLISPTLPCIAQQIHPTKKTDGFLSLRLQVDSIDAFQQDQATAYVSAHVTRGANQGIDKTEVLWRVVRANNFSPAMQKGWEEKTTGLAWGSVHTGVQNNTGGQELESMAVSVTNADGLAKIALTDIVGQRTIILQAEATAAGTTATQQVSLSFGPGPLAVFSGPPSGRGTWAAAAVACSGLPGNARLRGYQASTRLPQTEQLQKISAPPHGKGALYAAGWINDHYWSGDSEGSDKHAKIVSPGRGLDIWGVVTNDFRWACVP